MPPQGYTTPGAPVGRPKTIDQAVLLMRVGAGLSLLSLVVGLGTRGMIRDAVEASGADLTAGEVATAVAVASAVGIFAGLVGIGLWLWMAAANGKGRSWARIVATVFFVVSVLSFLASFAQPSTAVSRILAVLSVALGGYIIFLLYRPESSAYYQAQSRPKY